MMRLLSWTACLAAVLLVSACGGNRASTLPDFESGGGAVEGGDGSGGASTQGFDGGGGIGQSALTPEQQRLMENLVVYFEFDRSEIQPQFNDMLAAHGQYLANNPQERVRLEGHADERGTREYNIGLGERRAQSVRRILMLQGASADQISTVSYGEERPAATGSDEEAYQLNRRVEIVYR